MNSCEKLRQALDQIEMLCGAEDVKPETRMAASFLIMLRPRLEPMIPQDPGELDHMLGRLSDWALAQRSDAVLAAE